MGMVAARRRGGVQERQVRSGPGGATPREEPHPGRDREVKGQRRAMRDRARYIRLFFTSYLLVLYSLPDWEIDQGPPTH